MKKIILEEVNVKELKFVDESSGVIRKKAKANFKVLGPKFGKDMKAVSEAIKNFDNKTIAEIEKSGSVKVRVNGTETEITNGDIEIQTESIEGWVVESSESLTVALDTKLDDKLVAEGLVREFVNKIQNLRYLIIEVAFCNRERELAVAAKHFCPSLLAEELPPGRAAALCARITGRSRNEVYSLTQKS